jgi:hypothetical protein
MPGGRPSKYKKIDLEQLKKLAALGLTDKQMAHVFGITEKTFNTYKKHKEFLQSLKDGKKISDSRVIKSLYERATGYEHPEDKIFNHNGTSLVVPTTKHYPPDTTAAIFWLKNRKPEDWKDKQTIEGGDAPLKILVKDSDEL